MTSVNGKGRLFFFYEVNLKQTLERRGVSHEDNWLTKMQGIGQSKYKRPMVRRWLVYLGSVGS